MSTLFPVARTAHLPEPELFQHPTRELTVHEQWKLSFERAKIIAQLYGITAHDILTLSEQFWEFHMDNIGMIDAAAITFLSIQYNLAAGTIAPFAMKRPDLQPLLQHILDLDVADNGNTLSQWRVRPTHPQRWSPKARLHLFIRIVNLPPLLDRHMPPTGPYGGVIQVAVVFARLIVNKEDRGIRPFIVSLGDGKQMCKGVTARLLPRRVGSKTVGYALTTFNHVCLPTTALLGKLEKPADARINFMACIWRVPVGSLASSAAAVPAVAVSTYIAARHSMRRTITGPDNQPLSIWNFRTQQIPIVRALAQAYAMKAHALEAIRLVKDTDMDVRTRMGVAASANAVMIQHTQTSLFTLSERCGAHGLFEHNQIITAQVSQRSYSSVGMRCLTPETGTDMCAGHIWNLLVEIV
ncbi:hypothetical protein BD410DRAFT_886239 [Rickenella mellea]|uniref:Acyl-CoA dehydrogenase NM domain-like protein n=1 Tax=Rickenella mellea TaxID=50990 RepID=A0A4Y7PNH6_9AGAM|nr:hypothetical protein BD410DRAFT_886239 [Rickenella mellea]